jgi:hypothetical protein
MFFKEVWISEEISENGEMDVITNPAYIFAKDNNIWVMSLLNEPTKNEKINEAINEYIKTLNDEESFVNIFYSTNFDIMQMILDKEKFEEEYYEF